MSEENYLPDDWVELKDLIDRINDAVEEQDFYEIEGDELDILKNACEYIKSSLNIVTGEKITISPITGERYRVNIWTEKDDLITAISKTKLTENDEE